MLQNAHSDCNYSQVDIDFEGQTLPVLLDTGSADLFVASTECPTTDESSGCFGLTEQFVIDVSEPFSHLLGNLRTWMA